MEYTFEEYSGELPHPELLARFDEIVPGSAQMIFEEMQSNGSHRRAVEKRVSQVNVWTFGFSVVATHLAEIAMLGFGAALIWTERPWWGLAVLIGQVAFLRWGKKG